MNFTKLTNQDVILYLAALVCKLLSPTAQAKLSSTLAYEVVHVHTTRDPWDTINDLKANVDSFIPDLSIRDKIILKKLYDATGLRAIGQVRSIILSDLLRECQELEEDPILQLLLPDPYATLQDAKLLYSVV